MGYNTNYSLTTAPDSAVDVVREAFVQACDGYDPFDDACIWYKHEVHARDVSLAFPGVIICIRGEGEEHGDEWILYAFKGECVKTKREPWVPPGPPPMWHASSAEVKAAKKAMTSREKDLAELARLKAKYPNA